MISANGTRFGVALGAVDIRITHVEGNRTQGWTGTFTVSKAGEVVDIFTRQIPYAPNPMQALETALRQEIVGDAQDKIGLGRRYSSPQVTQD